MSDDPRAPGEPTGPSLDAHDELLLECMQRTRAEWERAVEQVCADRPSVASELRARFDGLRRAGLADQRATAIEIGERQFGGYMLRERLGRGGMGDVFRATQIATGREVALKLIRADFLDLPRARDRFQREVAAAASLEHPGICTVYDAGDVDGVPYIAMQLIRGESLAERLERDRPTADTHSASRVPTSRDELFTAISWPCEHVAPRRYPFRDGSDRTVTPSTLVAMINMGFLLKAQGKLDKAESYCRNALEGCRRVFGDSHPKTAKSRLRLSRLLREAGSTALAEGNTSTAEARILEAHAILLDIRGSDDEHTRICVAKLAEILDARHAEDPTAGHDRRAAEWRAKLAR